VTGIFANTGWYVDCVKLLFSDRDPCQYGNTSGDKDTNYELNTGEYITSVTQHNSKVGHLGYRLVFHLSSFRDITIEGTQSKKWKPDDTHKAPAGQQVCGLKFEGSKLIGVQTVRVDSAADD